jgi:hypothetical protein
MTGRPIWLASRVFLNNRYLDPVLGRFISVDPLVSVTGSAYGYGNNNPISRSDPSGLCDACIWSQGVTDATKVAGAYALGAATKKQGTVAAYLESAFRDNPGQMTHGHAMDIAADAIGQKKAWNEAPPGWFLFLLGTAIVVMTGGFLAEAGVPTAVIEAADGARRLACHSFRGDTKVEMADGSRKPIDEIAVGDKVKATDPQSGLT